MVKLNGGTWKKFYDQSFSPEFNGNISHCLENTHSPSPLDSSQLPPDLIVWVVLCTFSSKRADRWTDQVAAWYISSPKGFHWHPFRENQFWGRLNGSVNNVRRPEHLSGLRAPVCETQWQPVLRPKIIKKTMGCCFQGDAGCLHQHILSIAHSKM